MEFPYTIYIYVSGPANVFHNAGQKGFMNGEKCDLWHALHSFWNVLLGQVFGESVEAYMQTYDIYDAVNTYIRAVYRRLFHVVAATGFHDVFTK